MNKNIPYEFLVFFSLYIQKKYDLCRIGRQIRDKEKNGFKNNILPLVCDNRDIIVNLIKNTNKKQSYVR